MILRRAVPPALRALLLALAATLLAAPAQASLPTLSDLARASDEVQARPSALSADLPREQPTELPKECNGPFCVEQAKTRVGGFDLRLSCSIGGEGGLTCGSRRAYGLGYGGRAVERSVFTGHVFDSETGLYNAKARYFDPKLGRFLTQDSYLGQIDEPPSLHRYLYANDNPARFIDPTGHSALDWLQAATTEAERGAKATARMVLGPFQPAFGIVERSVKEKSIVAGVKGEFRDTVNQYGAVDEFERRYKGGYGLPRAALEGGREHVANMVASVVPVRDIPTMLDSSENPWVRAEAAANTLAKTATLALGIVGGGVPRAGVLEEGLSGPRIAPVETSTVTADLAQTRTAAAGARQATAAPSVSPHRMSAELVRDGEVIQSGDFVSGQTRGAKNWQGQLRVHTERMAVRSAEAVAEEGDLLRMNGQLDPCRVGCQPAVRNFVDTTGASAEYNASLTGRTFRWAAQRFGELKGTVLQEVFEQGGELAGRWRYWRTEAGRWRKAALPSQEGEHATGTSGK